MKPTHRPSRSLVLSVVLFALAAGHADEGDTEIPRTLDAAPGVTVIFRPHAQRFDDSNSGWIETDRGVVIVDAPIDGTTVDAWIDRARARGLDVRYLISTHWHGDHTQGNARLREAFGDGLTIIGHRSLGEEVPGRAGEDHRRRVETLREQIPAARKALAEGRGLSGQELDEAQQERQAAAIAQGEAWLETNDEVRFLPPDIGYEGRLALESAGPRVELHHFRGHTRGDTVVWLPESGVLFTGDLIDELPYIGHGYPRSWLEALDTIATWPVKTIIPGHGGLLKPDHVAKLRGYLGDIVRQVDAARERGETLEQARESIDLSVWRERLATDEAAGRFFDGTLAEAIEAAWRETESE